MVHADLSVEINTGDWVLLTAAGSHETRRIFGEIARVKHHSSNGDANATYDTGFTKLGPRVFEFGADTFFNVNNITMYATAFRKAVSSGNGQFCTRHLKNDWSQCTFMLVTPSEVCHLCVSFLGCFLSFWMCF